MNKLLKITSGIALGEMIYGTVMAATEVNTSATITYRIGGKTYKGTANVAVNQQTGTSFTLHTPAGKALLFANALNVNLVNNSINGVASITAVGSDKLVYTCKSGYSVSQEVINIGTIGTLYPNVGDNGETPSPYAGAYLDTDQVT